MNPRPAKSDPSRREVDGTTPSRRQIRIAHKLDRLSKPGARPRVVDLFCGAGGFSLGFHRAGFEILGGVEMNGDAIRSHARNFHGAMEASAPPVFAAHRTPRDIRETDPVAWLEELGVSDAEQAVDVLIGGPPCPAYTRVGRAKLREIRDDPEAHLNDDRATLYLPYLKWVSRLAPLALVMENVPDILNFAGHNLAEEICEVLEGLGYDCWYTILNAASYGVPQTRPRFILVGLHRMVGGGFAFPAATHQIDLPPGYKQARMSALRPLREGGVLDASRFVPVEGSPTGLPQAVTAMEAFAGLPPLREHLAERPLKVRTRPDESSGMPYSGDLAADSWVARHMLHWPGFGRDPDRDEVTAHIIRGLSFRDFRLFRALEPGEQYFEAYRRALELLEAYVDRLTAVGGPLPEASPAGGALRDELATFLASLEVLLSDPAATMGALDDLAACWGRLCPKVLAMDREGARVLEAMNHHRIEQARPSEVLHHPHEVHWRETSALLQALRRTPEVPLLRDLARGASRLYNRTRRWRNRRDSWRSGLQTLDPQGRFRTDRGFDLDLPCGVRGGRAIASDLANAAEALDAMPTRQMFWGPSAPWRSFVELLALRAVELSQHVCAFPNIKQQFVPPYTPDKFPNKWRKMEPDAPARTLMAHLGKDSYSHIHPDDSQARTISVREAARLQSFPDGFRFEGRMNSAFRQIGNAVPPMLSWNLARAVALALSSPATDWR